jgi:hypothetical protein
VDGQNLGYALIQVLHNFGAAAAVGGALFGIWPLHQPAPVRIRLAWLVLAAWTLQGASGTAFGALSYAYYGSFPDISGVAVAALFLKVACAACGFLLAAAYLRLAPGWTDGQRERAWTGLLVLAATALTAAAFLRWFS